MRKLNLTLFTSIVMVAIGCTKEQDMPLDTVQQTNATKMTCGRVASDTVNTNKARQASPYAIGTPYITSLWRNKTVYIKYDKDLPKFDKAIVMAAAKNIQEKTTIKFVERTDQGGYVLIRTAAFGALSSSPIGYAPGEQIFEAVRNLPIDGATHHLCHIIGLFDEHNRMYRDHSVKILWENVSIRSAFQKNRVEDLEQKIDLKSIMMHDSYYDTKNGKPTMIRVSDGKVFPKNTQLSPTDIKVINDLYKNK